MRAGQLFLRQAAVPMPAVGNPPRLIRELEKASRARSTTPTHRGHQRGGLAARPLTPFGKRRALRLRALRAASGS
eukprot:11712971-Alexandrium_andersonii.AAC.1